ncbi:hypothetical protein GCM10010517_40650 [Streptosporangium fragile]|uniref:Peptidase inhibitor family I36 n=1 Tax=Streptosporangium fragile TaxID=46186 RepID=A0ABN3W0I6_9ACTN
MNLRNSRVIRHLAIAFAMAASVFGLQAPATANADVKPDIPPLVAPADVTSVPAPHSAPDAAGVAAAECCGLVIRYDSIQNLVVAKDIRNYNAGYGSNCDIWNWNGGNTVSWVTADSNCRTASMNGHTYSYAIGGYSDTDAFTLQYEDYWLNMHGTWHRIGANVYTKISSIETAKCYRESDGVNCYVVY